MKRFMLFAALLLGILFGTGPYIVSAATIQGTVYDLDLTVVNDVILDISTAPHQRFVAQNGTYRFEVPPGTYIISAHFESAETELMSRDAVTVKQDGSYVFDIFLFPDPNEEEEFFEGLNLQVDEPILPSSSVSGIVYVALFIVFVLTLLIFLKMVWKKGIFRKGHNQDATNNQDTPPTREGGISSSHPEPHSQAPTESANPSLVNQKINQDIHSNQQPQQPDELYGKQILDILQKNQGRMTQKEIRKELPLSEAKVSLLITELEHAAKIKKIKKGRGNIIVLQ